MGSHSHCRVISSAMRCQTMTVGKRTKRLAPAHPAMKTAVHRKEKEMAWSRYSSQMMYLRAGISHSIGLAIASDCEHQSASN